MVLTAHRGICVYCGRSRATTLDHERPVAERGADIWWNFVPACDGCNRWKNGRTARNWVRDMDLHHRYPKVGFTSRAMRPEVYVGIPRRVERVQGEIADIDRRDWFRHHYGRETHRVKAGMFEALERCKTELKGYPYHPWTAPKVREADADTCVRRVCCGWKDRQAWFSAPTMILAEEDRTAFLRAAYRAKLYPGDLLGELVRKHLADLNDSIAE
ncbi:HNH endonuclease [Streptomyces sp. NBC_00878]|uniref:HNH endonuclease n=1 Tax=Streptomyces sp. NBC_00878 TaxID=2975854 RepID=UPI002259A956|nr:HNH endonuclease signature motif containing protein [Streptomyces sp. NBC_00878]MCX4909605.1 HNH endonuclease [Streptomyces sp. NBC_00878]